MISLKIDGKSVKVGEPSTILQVAQRLGIEIPTLCHHPALEPYAACRICMVEVVRGEDSELVTACNTLVQEGMVVWTRSPRVLDARRMNLELLMSRAPKVKVIQALAGQYGIKKVRFPMDNPEEDCILCGLCVRVCESVVGASAICFANRGSDRMWSKPFDRSSDDCIACGACTYLCPTGAVQMEAETVERFREEPGKHRECRYSLMGILPYALCANSFRCAQCEVEQRFRDHMDTHPIFVARNCDLDSVSAYYEFLRRIRKEKVHG
jgi:bidirectional [NiFe] hydrogenase diaphorase subunit